MAKIAYILLCHKDPDAIIQQARRLTAVGDYMSIHFDARSRPDHYNQIRDALEQPPSVSVECLTVAGVDGGRFEVALIPHTLAVTTLGTMKVGDPVNLEGDILAKYVAALQEARA